MSIRVSVVIPAYNAARFIGRTLEGILAQDYAPCEIIVVNDGSTDETAAIAGAFASAVSLINVENSGPTGARLTGVSAAKHDWLAFCDADDLWHPDHLSGLVGLASRHSVPFAFSNFTHVNNGRRAERSHFEADPDGFWIRPGRAVANEAFVAEAPLFARVVAYQAVFPSCTLVSKHFLERVGGFNLAMGRNVSEDLEFTLRCVLQKPAGIVVRPTVDIYRHGYNHTQDWIRTLAGSIAILKYAYANYRLPAEYATALRQEIISKSILAIDCCFTQRRFDEVGEFAENLSRSGTPLRTAIKIGVSHQPKALALFLRSVLASGASAAALPRSLRRSR